MDSKNIIAAISLSAAVIILFQLFFAPTPQERKQIQSEKNNTSETTDAPSLEQSEQVSTISRTEAINEEKRIIFENDSIKGSIALTGSSIDDLTFKKYTKTLNGNDNIVLLNPKKVENGYYVETGWVTANKNIKIPNSNSIWKIEGNNKLTPTPPVKLIWTNLDNIKFEKKISIDNQYLFTINQTITNKSEKIYNFYT